MKCLWLIPVIVYGFRSYDVSTCSRGSRYRLLWDTCMVLRMVTVALIREATKTADISVVKLSWLGSKHL